MKKLIYASPAFVILFAGCALLGKPKHGELTRRYEKQVSQEIQDIQKYVDIQGYAFAPENADPAKPKNFFDLSPNVQEKLIKVFGKKDSTSAMIIKSITQSFTLSKQGGDEPVIDDRTTFKKRLAFSMRNKSYNPADRIWKVNIKLSKLDNNIRFSNNSTLATDFEAVDIGKLAFNRKSNFSTALTAGSGVSLGNSEKNTSGSLSNTESKDDKTGTTSSGNTTTGKETSNNRSVENKIDGTVNFGSDFSSNEEVNLKQRFVKLSGSVKKNELTLYQESTSGIDLSGNIIADVEFSYEATASPNEIADQIVFEFGNLKTGSSYNEPAALTVKPFVVVYPAVNRNIYGSISFEAVMRKVNANDNTIAESDDDVAFLGGEHTNPAVDSVLLLSRKDITPMFWNILNTTGNPIRIKSLIMQTPVDLRFRSFESAKNFLEWLKTKAAAAVAVNNQLSGGVTLLPGAGVTSLDIAAINSLSVNIVINH